MKKVRNEKIITKNKKESLNDDFTLFEILKRFLVVWFLMFFCALLITQQESFWIKMSNSPDNVIFVLPWKSTDWWIDINETWTHWAAWDWDYLFEDEETNNNQWNTQTNSWNKDDLLPIEDNNIPLNNKDELPISDEDIFSESSTWLNNTWELVATGLNLNSWLQNQLVICITPWWERIADGDFVLAYEQRKDVTNLCNVQKRYCEDWKLSWVYTQKSCKEHTLYSYLKPEPISYNQETVDPFVQPGEPSLSWADFDNHWKIDWTIIPIDVWWSPGSWNPADNVSVSQTTDSSIQCVTPWWETVKNGHFVKAYKSSVGFIDLPCEVEIRLCVSWKLKWYYTNRACTFKNMTYRDYLVDNYDNDTPSIWDIANSINTQESEITYRSSAFWKLLEKYF